MLQMPRGVLHWRNTAESAVTYQSRVPEMRPLDAQGVRLSCRFAKTCNRKPADFLM